MASGPETPSPITGAIPARHVGVYCVFCDERVFYAATVISDAEAAQFTQQASAMEWHHMLTCKMHPAGIARAALVEITEALERGDHSAAWARANQALLAMAPIAVGKTQ